MSEEYKQQFVAVYKDSVSSAMFEHADFAWTIFEDFTEQDRETKYTPTQAVELVMSIRG